MRILLAIALCLPLQGCFFIWIPGSAISAVADAVTGSEGDNCVSEYTKVGDTFQDPKTGRSLVVKSLSGRSTRCTVEGQPIRAKLVLS